MKTWVIINTAMLWMVIIYLIIKPQIERLEIKIERTLWEQKPYGITLTRWDFKRDHVPNSGRGIFAFRWRNPDKLKDDINNRKS